MTFCDAYVHTYNTISSLYFRFNIGHFLSISNRIVISYKLSCPSIHLDLIYFNVSY